MTSAKQIEANRRNAALSTGPRSDAGKAAVSLSAVRHGLRAQRVVIEGESQDEFDDFRNRLIGQMAPADSLEVLLVDRIAAGFWRLCRTGQIEAQMFDEMRQSLYDDTKQAAGPAATHASRIRCRPITPPSRMKMLLNSRTELGNMIRTRCPIRSQR